MSTEQFTTDCCHLPPPVIVLISPLTRATSGVFVPRLILSDALRDLDDVVRVRLEHPDVLPSFLPQRPVKDHVGLGLCRDIAQLLACEVGTFICFVPFDEDQNSSTCRVNESLPGSFADPVCAQMYASWQGWAC